MAEEIEILPAGEEGPRRLDNPTVARMVGLPFLTISEFVRAKLRSWTRQVTSLLYLIFIYRK